jgi:hypothetical protein
LLPACPAKLQELVCQLAAWVRVNACRRGKGHLHLGQAAVAAEVGIAAITQGEDVLAGDLPQHADPPAAPTLLLGIGSG